MKSHYLTPPRTPHKHGSMRAAVGRGLAGAAKVAARYALRYGTAGAARRLFKNPDKGAELKNVTHGVESGFAAGHNAFTKHKGISRLSKKQFKKKARFEKKVRSAIQGTAKYQQFLQNTILGATIQVDGQDWFEIPVMCGGQYVQAGTSTDANTVYYRNINDSGDYQGAADVAANSLGTINALSSSATASGAALLPSSQFVADGKFLVYGYDVQYQIQNIQSFPIEVEIFEVDCVKDLSNVGATNVFSTATSYIGGLASSTTTMANLAGTANIARFTKIQESGNEVTKSLLNWGATPMMLPDMGAYMVVKKSHIHILDASQVLRLEKKYVFKNPIRFQDMNTVLFKKGVSHVICGAVRSAVLSSGAGGGYQGAALGGVAIGTGSFTHSYAVTYQKRYVVKPLSYGNTTFGFGQISS